MNVLPAKFVIENLCYIGFLDGREYSHMAHAAGDSDRSASSVWAHLQVHWDCLPRVLWNRHMANSVTWSLRFRAVLIYVRLSRVDGSLPG